MKTKQLMTAFALSAMFAACSQDAELNDTLAKNDYSNIPVVEAEFTANVGTESRMANQFGWEPGDKVGLAWLGYSDILSGNVSGMAYQNHPLFCTDATKKAFKTETMLYVGDYFAYMPYNPNVMGIENIKFNIAKQPLTTSSNDLAKQAIYLSTARTTLEVADANGNVAVGSQEAGMGNNVKLNLDMLTNAATIKLTFTKIDALTDLKVTGVKIGMWNSSASSGNIMPVEFLYNGSATGDWTEQTGAEFFGINSTFTRNVVSLEGELAVANNALTTYALLLPAMTQNAAASSYLKISLVTNYGDVEASDVKVDNTDIYNYFGEVATVTANVDGSKIKKTSATVKIQAELNDVLNKVTELKQTDAITITLNPETANSGKTFVLTDFTMPEELKAFVKLTTGDKASNGIVFAGNTVINKKLGLAETNKVTGTMTVKYIKDIATLTNGVDNVESKLTIDNEAILNNYGYISSVNVITTAATTGDNAKAAGKYVHAGENAELLKSLANNGELQWLNGASNVPNYTGNLPFAEVTSYNDMMDAAGAKVKVARIMGSYYFDNAYTNVNVNYITNIECYGNVTFGIKANSINGASTVTMSALRNITVMEGASLSIYSAMWYNDEVNSFAWNKKGVNVTVKGDFSLSNIKINSDAKISNEGTVNTYNVTGASIVKTLNKGSWTEKEVK